VNKDLALRLITAALLSSVLALGCSFSTSSKSISDSISGSSTSSSGSDDGKSSEKDALYREDVRDFTAAYVREGSDVASFQRGLGNIARQHGISDWEALAATWAGIGEGLRRADATPQQVDATSSALDGGDPARRRAIRRAYAGQG
jgi:hypothetical protein